MGRLEDWGWGIGVMFNMFNMGMKGPVFGDLVAKGYVL